MQFHYYVYILRCADGSYYIGVTNDVDRRTQEHKDGINPNCYTFGRRPLELAYAEWYHDIRQAKAREKQLKRWTRAKKESLIKQDMRTLREHAVAYHMRTSGGHGSTGSP